MTSYPIGIVGESFRNEDGTSRQVEIRRCRPGESVTLVREPDNKFDANCVKVISARGIQIGNLSRDDPWICERIDAGRHVDARVLSINLAASGKQGVVICVRTDEDDEWLPEARSVSKQFGCSLALLIIFTLISMPGILSISS